MAVAENSRDEWDPGRVGAGLSLSAVGAVVLIVSLFLNWYQPGRNAWQVFEVWDLVLAAIAIFILTGIAGQLGWARAVPGRWLLGASMAAVVIVVDTLINPPPAAGGYGLMAGAWLALAGSLVMLLGTALAVARISVTLSEGPSAPLRTPSPAGWWRQRARRGQPRRTGPESVAAGPAAPPVHPPVERADPDATAPISPTDRFPPPGPAE